MSERGLASVELVTSRLTGKVFIARVRPAGGKRSGLLLASAKKGNNILDASGRTGTHSRPCATSTLNLYPRGPLC